MFVDNSPTFDHLHIQTSDIVVMMHFWNKKCFAAFEQDLQHRRAAGAHELIQHRWRYKEDPPKVQAPPCQDTHLQPEQVTRPQTEDCWVHPVWTKVSWIINKSIFDGKALKWGLLWFHSLKMEHHQYLCRQCHINVYHIKVSLWDFPIVENHVFNVQLLSPERLLSTLKNP